MRRVVPYLVVVSVVALVVGTYGCGGHGSRSPSEMTPQAKPVPGNTISGKVTFADGSAAEGVTISVDSDGEAPPDYQTLTDRKGKYLIEDVEDGEYTVLAEDGEHSFVADPPGSNVGVEVDGDAQVVNFVEEGGSPPPPPPPADWAVTFTHRDRAGRQTVWVMTADGGSRKQLTSVGRIERDSWPTWTPNGTILFMHEPDYTGGPTELYVVDPDSGDLTFIGTPSPGVSNDDHGLDVLADDPEGRRVLFYSWSATAVYMVDFARDLHQNLNLAISDGGLSLMRGAPSNSISGEVILADGSAAAGVTVSADDGEESAPDYSAVTNMWGRYAMTEVDDGEYTVTVDDSEHTFLAYPPGSNENVVIAGGGQVVNFVEEGGDPPQFLHVDWYPFGGPAPGPDSDSAAGFQGLIAYHATLQRGDTGSDICIVEVDTEDGALVRADDKPGGPTCWLERAGDQTAPAIAPDGNWVAFQEEGNQLCVAELIRDETGLHIGSPVLVDISPALEAKGPKWGQTATTQFVVYHAKFVGPKDTYWAIARTPVSGGVFGTPEKITPDGESADNWPDWNPNCTQ